MVAIIPRPGKREPPTLTGGWRNVLLGGRRLPAINNGFWAYNADYSLDHHTGVDFGAASGTPINLPLAGKVVSTTSSGPYGNSVLVQLTNGDYMRFAHMKNLAVGKGQSLKAGAYLGSVGNTGTSTDAHLHLEVMTKASGGTFAKGSFVDPVAYLNGKKTAAIADKGTDTQRTTRDEPPGSDAMGSTTTNVTYSDGGWSKMAKSGFSKKDFYASLSSMFGSIDILLDMDKAARAELGGKSIKEAIDQMVKQKIVDPSRARTLLMETAWFKKYGEDTTKRLIEEKQRPGVSSDQVTNRQAAVTAYLQGEGVSLPADVLASLSRNAYVYGWDDARLQQEIKNSTNVDVSGRNDMLTAKFNEMGVQLSQGALDRLSRASWQYGWTDATLIDEIQALGDNEVSFSGGAIAQGIEDITTYADDYGVKLSDADVRQFRNDYLDGLGDQRSRETLQERAAQTYAVFADQIRAGQSTRSLASAYFNTAADLLETDADSIEWDDPLFAGGKAFTGTNEKGQQAVKGLWDFEKEIRQDTRWMTTKNARDDMIGATTGLLKTMGLV